jgi:Cu-processing system ATP-binding protein
MHAPSPAPPSVTAPEPPPILTAEGITKRFGRHAVLKGVGLALARGRVTAVVGPNASGKTTLVKSLLGLVRPDAGRVVFDGEEVRPGDVAYRARIGYMPQAARFPEHLTAREVLALLRDLRPGADADETLAGALGLAAELDRPLRLLSGGTRQKANAVVAFLFRPALVVLDEPTAGLDPVAAGVLKDRIRAEQARGTAFLLTSHLMGEIEELADDLVFLLDGRVRFAGRPDDLRALTGADRLERALAHLMTTDR